MVFLRVVVIKVLLYVLEQITLYILYDDWYSAVLDNTPRYNTETQELVTNFFMKT